MEPLKKAFCEAMVKTFGNITHSCQAVDISRQTYYNWKEQDPQFKEAVEGEEYEERLLDFLESKLIKQADEENTAILIFMAKTKGKKRGYIEKSEHGFTDRQGNDIVPVVINPAPQCEPLKNE